MPLDLHVLGLPLAFILSQDQTLHGRKVFPILIVFFLLRWTFCVYAAILFCLHSFFITTAGQRALTYNLYCSLGLPPALGNSVFVCAPIPLVGVAKVVLFFYSPNFSTTFILFSRSAETPTVSIVQPPFLPVSILSKRVQK